MLTHEPLIISICVELESKLSMKGLKYYKNKNKEEMNKWLLFIELYLKREE